MPDDGSGREATSHLGIENAGIRLNNADGLIERLQGEIFAVAAAHNSSELKPKILRMQFRNEIVGKTFLLTSWYLDIKSRRGKVANDTATLRIEWWRPERSADKLDCDWFWLLIGKGEERLGGLAIDELDAEDLRRRERGAHGDSERRTLQLAFHYIFVDWVLTAVRKPQYHCGFDWKILTASA